MGDIKKAVRLLDALDSKKGSKYFGTPLEKQNSTGACLINRNSMENAFRRFVRYFIDIKGFFEEEKRQSKK